MSSDGSPIERRPLSDPRALRALTHPIRLALLELLIEGPLTATEAAERLGESPANCSFHLRTLAKYGYVEEAEGGRGRQRPWRRVPANNEIREDQLEGEAQIASAALVELLRNREIDRLRTWHATRATYPPEWRSAASEHHLILQLSAPELEKLGEAMLELLAPYARRQNAGAVPADALPVAIMTHAVPVHPPRADGLEDGGA
jgi:DNA-binding transcriptional ArsR family regulator